MMAVEETIGGGAGDDAAAAAAALAKAAETAGGQDDQNKGGDDAAKAALAAEAEAKTKAEAAALEEGTFGKDWRDKLAKGDAKKLERLARFASPEALLEAQEAAARKISEGMKPKGKPGEKATEADWQAYRKENGIPDVVDDYVKAIALPDQRVIGDDDKPLVGFFAERALKAGIAPADMAVHLDTYYALQEEQMLEQDKQDSDFKRESTKALRGEYGGDFDANVAALRPYFESVNEDLFGNLLAGRMADGRKIGDHPDILRFFITKAVAENPLATIVPAGGTGAEALDAEIKALETRMGADRNAWFKDDKAQARLQALYTARDKVVAAAK